MWLVDMRMVFHLTRCGSWSFNYEELFCRMFHFFLLSTSWPMVLHHRDSYRNGRVGSCHKKIDMKHP